MIEAITVKPRGQLFTRKLIRRTAIQEIAITAINQIRDRFTKTQTDGKGRKARPLRKRRGFLTSADDPRFLSIGKIVGKKVKVRVDKDYPTVKRKLGARPVKNFSLTGKAWKSLKPKIKAIPGGWVIEIKFSGQVKTGKIQVGTKLKQTGRRRKKGGGFEKIYTRVPKMKTVSFRNRDKAKQFQKLSKAHITLLSLNDQERQELVQLYLDAVEFFTAKGSRSKRMRRKFRRTRGGR